MSAAAGSAAGPHRGRVRRVGWERITHGVYAPAPVARDERSLLAAWALVLPPGAGFTGLTAAWLRGWWLPRLPPARPVFAALPNAGPRPRRRGLAVLRHTHEFAVHYVHGLPVLPPADVLLAAARDLALLDLVVLVDAAIQLGHVTMPDLVAATAAKRQGGPSLRRSLRWVDGRSESAWESILRVLLVSCGVPVEPQFVVTHGGRFVARGDLRVGEARRLLEYDGGIHRAADRHAADLAREGRLSRAGWQRFGYTARVLLREPGLVLLDADTALGRRHRPERLGRWYSMVAASSLSAAGLRRLSERWRATGDGRSQQTVRPPDSRRL